MEIYLLASCYISDHHKHQVRENTCGERLHPRDKRVRGKGTYWKARFNAYSLTIEFRT